MASKAAIRKFGSESDSEIESDEDLQELASLLKGKNEPKRHNRKRGREDTNNGSSGSEGEVDGRSDEEGITDVSAHSKLLRDLKSFGSGVQRPKKKVKFHNQTETFPESEFYAAGKENTRVSAQDLLATIGDAEEFRTLKKEAQKAQKKKGRSLPTPLGKVREEKINRKIAYDRDKKEIGGKWDDIVKRNREAESMSFPIDFERIEKQSTVDIAKKHKKQTDLEKEVEEILKQSGVSSEKEIKEMEEETLGELSKEERRQRKRKLAQLRNAMFYYEQKMRRMNKIKSKKFHKLRKQRRKGEELSYEDMKKIDPQRAEEMRVKAEMDRAEERLTLRHKASKFSKAAKKMNMLDQETRKAIAEQYRIGNEKRTKISQEESDSAGEEDVESVESEAENDILAQLRSEVESELPSKGLMGLKFMRDAVEKQREEAKDLLKELEGGTETENASGEDEEEAEKPASAGIGRRNFGEQQGTQEDTEVSIVDSYEGNRIEGSQTKENPWLSRESRSEKLNISRKQKKKTTRGNREVDAELGDEELKIDVDKTLVQASKDEEGEHPGNDMMMSSSNPHVQHLIRESFAGDGIEEEFVREKKDKIKEELNQSEIVELPGWGKWGGSTIKPKPSKFVKEARRKQKAEAIAATQQRKDASLHNVIITEKENKRGRKYKLSKLPPEYTSKYVYERSLVMPVGKEWNTEMSHRSFIEPKVKTMDGIIIDPIKHKHKIVPRKGKN